MVRMIGKTEFPHLLSPNKVNRKGQDGKTGNGSDSHTKKETPNKKCDDNSMLDNLITLGELQEIISYLNESEYYKAKEITFEIKSDDKEEYHVLAKTRENKVIQDLSPSAAKRIYGLAKINKSGKPLKGGLLNVAC